MLGLLKVSVSAMLATVRCSYIYCDIPTWVICFFAGRCSYLMALYRDLSYFSRDFIVYFRRALALLAGAISGFVVLEISPSTHLEVVWSS